MDLPLDGSRMKRLVDLPEPNVLVWEVGQVPLYKGLPSREHWAAIQICGRATLGDAAIAVVAFWAVAAMAKSRRWITAPATPPVVGFVGVVLPPLVVWFVGRQLT